MIRYRLPGSPETQAALYPDPARLDPATREKEGLHTTEAVIAHFTASSLRQDGIQIVAGSLHVDRDAQGYTVSFSPLEASREAAAQFAQMHVGLLDEKRGALALTGCAAAQKTPAWNPMAGYPVNRSDGPSEWLPCLPLGMPIVNHAAVTLLHYPPIVAYRHCDYLNNATLRRWAQLLTCAGVPQPERYHAIVDVNPIAAPGSGESEYPNDFFPINLTSLFFDNETEGLNYLRNVLALMLDPPGNAANPYTLPLLVGGSPLYDPQAPGWFRTRFKDQLPRDKNGSPRADVLQSGLVRLHPDSPKMTPYLIVNHMIAAGVTGKCGGDPKAIPNISKYEAQDLVAATFLALMDAARQKGQHLDPQEATRQACQRWFGADDGSGAPVPPAADDRLTLCALAQMDLCFDPKVVGPMWTFAQAQERCRQAGGVDLSPCFGCGELKA